MLRQREISTEQLSKLSDEGYVFAVVDACVDHDLVMEKANSGLDGSKAISLFKNTYMDSYTAAAPYLFRVDRDFLRWIMNLDESRWGIFVFSKQKQEELASHLQRFLMVALPDGHKGYFRYYDPRILKTYVLSCNPAELQQFFGPVRGFAVADGEEEKTLVFDLADRASSEPAVWPQYPGGLWPIHREQVRAFSNLSKEHFTKRVMAHLQEFFPSYCELYEEEQLRNFVLHSIQKAASHGITTEREVWSYIDIAFAYGKDFEHDSRCEWVAKILKDNSRSAADRIADVIERLEQQGGAE